MKGPSVGEDVAVDVVDVVDEVDEWGEPGEEGTVGRGGLEGDGQVEEGNQVDRGMEGSLDMVRGILEEAHSMVLVGKEVVLDSHKSDRDMQGMEDVRGLESAPPELNSGFARE